MKIAKIFSNRFYETWPSWHLIHEWEDVFARELSLKIENDYFFNNLLYNRFVYKILSIGIIGKIYTKINALFKKNEKYLIFVLSEGLLHGFHNTCNAIPIIIDLWKPRDAKKFIDKFNECYKNCELVLITSLETFNFLKANGCVVNIRHLALSISDKYMLSPATKYQKKFDIILAGRRNEVMWNYLQKFTQKYPQYEFLYQDQIDGKLFYMSNKNGKIGCFHTREEYIDLIRSCKIGFYATPGIDGGEKRTGGFNPVTPRYLEYLSAQCFLIGRYPDNEETDFFEFSNICPNANSYEEFEKIILQYLTKNEFPVNDYAKILGKHYTSVRCRQLINFIKECENE